MKETRREEEGRVAEELDLPETELEIAARSLREKEEEPFELLSAAEKTKRKPRETEAKVSAAVPSLLLLRR